jgi:glycerol-3-phosphate acyltransferase PlsY
VPLAYVIGSFPTGVIVGKALGVDVRTAGSRNIGATNVARLLGRSAGLFTLLGDVGKGVAAVAIARALGGGDVIVHAAAVAALLGHVFSVFLRFAGGKGVATGFGACLALAPAAMMLPLAVFGLAFVTTRIVSLASLAGGAALPFAMALAGAGRASVIVAAIVAVVIVLRHQDNLQRLYRGVEPRFGSRRSPPGG